MRLSFFLLSAMTLVTKTTADPSAPTKVVQNTILKTQARNLRVVHKPEDDSYDKVDTSDDEEREGIPISSLDDVLSGKVTRTIAKIQQKTGVKTALLDDMDYWFYKLYEGNMAKNLGIRSKTSASAGAMLSSPASNVGWSPRTVESNESTASPCNVSEVVVTATKPKKKRVRRAKLELEFLRQESKKLEDELAQLLVIQAQRPPNTNCIVSTAQQITDSNGYRPIAPRQLREPSVWHGIALRQSHARGRSLVRNLELRARLEAEIKLGKQLVQLLERQSNVKVLCRSVAKQDGTFRKLLERAEDLLLEMKKDLQGKAFSDPNASFNDTFVEKEGEKETFVMQANMTIPFCKDATAKALWKVLSSDEIDEYCYYHQVAHKTETVVAQVFGIHYNDGCMSADFRGKYIFSRFKEEDRIVIVWVAESELVELNGEKLSGVQGGTRGWIQVSDATTKKTLVRSYSRLNMETGSQHDLSLHSFSNLFQRIHDKFLASYSATMEKALIEEDWKLSCGQL